MNEEKWQKRLFWLVIGTLVTVVITALFTPLINYAGNELHINFSLQPTSNTAINLPTPSFAPTVPLVQLKHSYNGTLVGGVYSPSNISFTFTSQGQDGNITSTLLVSGDYYNGTGSCTGTLDHKRHLILKCHDNFNGCSYTSSVCLDAYEGDILSDSSIKGHASFQNGLVYDWEMS